MPDYYPIIQRFRFMDAVEMSGYISKWQPEILDAMYEGLNTDAGLNVNEFCHKHHLRYYTVDRLLDKMVTRTPEVIELLSSGRPKIYRYKLGLDTNQVQTYLLLELKRLSGFEGFRAAFIYQSDKHDPLLQGILSDQEEQIPDRLIRAASFGVTVAQSLNLYIHRHKDDSDILAKKLEKLLKEDTEQAIPQLIEWSRLWLNHEDRHS